VSDAIERVIADVQRYSVAGERLAERLLEQSQWNLDDIERLRSGVSLIESCRETGSAERSRSMTRLLAEFEESRRAIRSATVLGLLEDGLSITEIGQVFGVSRQLANRLVKDARAMYGEASAPA
jgi:ATP/maltotriose-dependent transcriptional regulator MalT